MDRPERQHPRYAHEAEITLETPGQTITGRTHNVSRGGLCATLSEEIALGSEIGIALQLVFEHGQRSEPLVLPGRVVWCTGIDDHHQVGVQFLPFDADTAEYLTMFLRYLDDETSGRHEHAAASIDERFR